MKHISSLSSIITRLLVVYILLYSHILLSLFLYDSSKLNLALLVVQSRLLVRTPSTPDCSGSGILKQGVKALSRHVELLHYLCLVQAAIHPLLVL